MSRAMLSSSERATSANEWGTATKILLASRYRVAGRPLTAVEVARRFQDKMTEL